MNTTPTTLRAALVVLPSLAAWLVASPPAWAAEPQDVFEGAPAATEAPQPAPPVLPQQAAPAIQAAPTPFAAPQPPIPATYPPGAYPYASRPRVTEHEEKESEGPVISWEPLRFAIALEGRGVLLNDRGAKRLAGERTPTSGGVSLQGDVFRLQDKLVVRLDLAWVLSSHTSYMSGSQASERLETNLFSLGLSVRYHLLQWIAPYARLSGGAGWDKLSVADMSDRQRFGHGGAGVGLFLRSPGIRPSKTGLFPSVGLVGQIEAGYTLASGSDFVLSGSPAPGGTTPIPTSSTVLGHAERSASYARVSLGIAF